MNQSADAESADIGTDETMARITAAVELAQSGHMCAARDALTTLWDQIGADGDALHRCTLAHYLADLQDNAEAALGWDERALAAAAGLTDARAQRYHSSLQVQAFLPSLHLNLADAHRRCGNTDLAREHLVAARDLIQHLPAGPYGDMVRAGIANVAHALDAGSTRRLDSHP